MDVLDRVLDKGVVIDAWARLSVVGIDLITCDSRVVVTSIETRLNHSATARRPGSLAEALGQPPTASPEPGLPPLAPIRPPARPRTRIK